MGIKYFTKNELIAAAVIGNTRGYNRQLNAETLAEDLSEELKYPVIFAMVHEHIAGEPVEPHMRVVILTGEEGRVTLDMSTDMYNALASVEIPSV